MTAITIQNYTYRAFVFRVVDGDTICCHIDLKSRFGLDLPQSDVLSDMGFRIWAHVLPDGEMWYKNVRIRLFGINAPEKTGVEKEQGIRSKNFLKSLVEGQEIYLETVKDKSDDFGRYLGIIYHQGVKVNDMLVERGYAQTKQY